MPAPDRYALIGHPVAESLSPRIHTLFAQQTRQNLIYAALDVQADRLGSALREFFAAGGRGMNVTVPHKQAAAVLLDRLSARAERAGAVNTIARQDDSALFGDNTDGVGLVRDLTENLQLSLRARRILLLGAGGAARGIVGPLLELAPGEIVIVNRTLDRALGLARSWAASGVVHAVAIPELAPIGFDLIINAIPPSARAPTLPPDVLQTTTVCYDMAYGPQASPFQRWASAGRAACVHGGLGMLVEQAAESFALWRGLRPHTAPVLAALRTELTRASTC